jgi:hypothetical protein
MLEQLILSMVGIAHPTLVKSGAISFAKEACRTSFCEQLQTLRPKKLRTFQLILLIKFAGVAL